MGGWVIICENPFFSREKKGFSRSPKEKRLLYKLKMKVFEWGARGEDFF